VITYPAWLIGQWSGIFTDGCGAQDGNLTLTATALNARWWGQWFDTSRNYVVELAVTATASG